MSDEHTEGGKAGDAGETESLRGRLEHFGDAHNTWDWHTGEVDYVAQLALTAADVPELIAVARQWAEPLDWPEDEDDVSGFAPIHAWRGLAQLGATEAIGPLLEMMEPLSATHDDWYLEEFPDAFALIGPASLAPLREYLMDARHSLYPRTCAASGLRELAKRHGQFRNDVLKALCDALSQFEQADTTFNGLIVSDLLDLKAIEVAELIERAHAADRVDLSICGCWETVRKELGVPGLGLVPKELATQSWSWVPEGQEGQEDQEDLEDLEDPEDEGILHLFGPHLLPEDPAEAPALPLQPAKKAGRNDPCPCGSGKKYKKCC